MLSRHFLTTLFILLILTFLCRTLNAAKTTTERCKILYKHISFEKRKSSITYKKGREGFNRLSQLLNKFDHTDSEWTEIGNLLTEKEVYPIAQYIGLHIPLERGKILKGHILKSVFQIVKDYTKLPEQWTAALLENGVETHLTHESVNEHPAMEGFESEGLSVYDSTTKTIIFPTSISQTSQGKHSIVLHELGHAIDFYVLERAGIRLWQFDAFKKAFEEESWTTAHLSDPLHLRKHFNGSAEESLAEAIDQYLLSKDSRQSLKKHMPETHKFVERILTSTPEEILELAKKQTRLKNAPKFPGGK